MSSYELLNSGNCCKIERFGEVVLARPCDLAVWPLKGDTHSDASFSRRGGEMKWVYHNKVPESWVIKIRDIKCKISTTAFGHTGLFYEHTKLWDMHSDLYSSFAKNKKSKPRILNLFAYTGVASVKMAKDGCFVTHVDSSRSAVNWANENAKMNNMPKDGIRWILEDVMRFLRRELRRGSKYDGIILDPPSFGRGLKGEVFKLQDHLWEMIEICRDLIDFNTEKSFVTLSSHSEGFSEHLLEIIMRKCFKGGSYKSGFLNLSSSCDSSIPSGYYSSWVNS